MADKSAIEPDDLTNIPTFRAAYSDRTALLMARLSRYAYEGFEVDDIAWKKFSDRFAQMGLKECVALVDADTGTAGYVAVNSDLIAVAFRGTTDRLDWRTNVNAEWIVLQGGVRVHMGFFQAYWPIRDTLFNTVVRLLGKNQRPVYVTGHSLGGALATMATAELANHSDAMVRDSIAACYTFGSPRVGDASFDQYVKVPLYRVTNGVDLVPAVPPAIMGYRHVGDTRYFGKKGVAPSRHSPTWWQKLRRTLVGALAFLRTWHVQNIADHNMVVYIGKLFAWMQQNVSETHQRREETADPEIKAKAA